MTVNVNDVVDTARFNRYHLALLIWSSVVIFFDCYDLNAFATIVPGMLKEWGGDANPGFNAVAVGLIGSAGFIGMAAGALVLGILADKLGRKTVLVSCVAVFSVFMFLEAFAPDPVTFTVFRVIAGFGIGGIMPNVLALLTDYIPVKQRNLITGILLCFFAVGGIVASALALGFLPAFGFRSMYWIAIIPVLLLPFMAKYLLNSPAWLIEKGRDAELAAILAKLDASAAVPANAELALASKPAKTAAVPVVDLFKERRTLSTIMFVIAFFMCLLMIAGVQTWLPTNMAKAGYALATGLVFAIILNVGAIVGTLVLAPLADRFGTKRVLVPMFVVSFVVLALVGITKDPLWLGVLFFIAGACTQGAQNIAYAFVAQYYPAEIRSTGVGFASGIGRVGQIIAPTYGGALLAAGWAPQLVFVAFAVPGLIAAVAFGFVRLRQRAVAATPLPVPPAEVNA